MLSRSILGNQALLRTFNRNALGRGIRLMTTTEPLDDYEQKIYNILQQEFQPKNLQVRDVSGGCGSMFAISVESEKFKDIPMVKQHRLVNEALKDEISKWHGIQLRTKSS
ncbi:Piso0_004065 [Millerozyma farinosa CBS 7064]|uniref:Piso0_004065 protein n=1 Tax=Pichia sorbitophila (strain ATCC MYA-4447 / BCRC 22081 / CBS 7064 / NBRC 10061 / NRRL Y-12695) TaxID=559304 RepID=G8YAA6_PICSO|nr:Piso0_004065 [Millerozyma farinosa CBS 7064]CCE84520.1 Piso0_004065 [Millerozyma farinosa CBS 7064]